MFRYITLERMGLRSDIHMRDGFVAAKAATVAIGGRYTGECDKTSYQANHKQTETNIMNALEGKLEAMEITTPD